MKRKRRQIGNEKLVFIDGEEKEVAIYAVADFEMMRLRRLKRKTIIDSKGKVSDVQFNDEEFIKDVIKLSMGSQIDSQDLEETETSLKEIYDKYFNKEVSKEKKAKSSDTSEQNQDNDSRA